MTCLHWRQLKLTKKCIKIISCLNVLLHAKKSSKSENDKKKMYCIVIILVSGTYMYCLYIWCHPCVVKEFLPLQRLVFSWFLISIYVGIIASLEPLYEAVFRVYYPFPNCCSLSLDCSWYSKGAISSNTNWWVYSTLPYISHGSKENIFGGIFLVLVEEINIFRGECVSCVCSLCAETISALLYRTQLSAGAMHFWHFMELSSRFKNTTF